MLIYIGDDVIMIFQSYRDSDEWPERAGYVCTTWDVIVRNQGVYTENYQSKKSFYC